MPLTPPLELAFAQYLRAQRLLPAGADRVLLAVSGGVDSVVLAHLCQRAGLRAGIAHVNFQLRGAESDGDARFVRALAERLEMPFFEARFDTLAEAERQKAPIQVVARELRYGFFEQIRQREGFDQLATAHHLDDSVETALMNLIRGCGIRGLHGILPHQPELHRIRPLLFARKSEILGFAHAERLEYREDSSNQTADYTRNRLRQQLVPLLEQFNPNFARSFEASIARFRATEWAMEAEIGRWRAEICTEIERETRVQRAPLEAHPHGAFILGELLRKYGFSESQLSEMLENTDEIGARWIADNHVIVREKTAFILLDKNTAFIPTDSVEIRLPEARENAEFLVQMPDFALRFWYIPRSNPLALAFAPERAYLSAAKLADSLILRPVRDGDKLAPFGMGGHQKLVRDLVKDQKIPSAHRRAVWVLESQGTVAWVVGLRASELYRTNAGEAVWGVERLLYPTKPTKTNQL